jgi:hypothetical protein
MSTVNNPECDTLLVTHYLLRTLRILVTHYLLHTTCYTLVRVVFVLSLSLLF